MALDLNKLRGNSLINKEPNPREIFNLLPNKDNKYQYLRDVQAEVLDRWFDRRNDKDTVLKMNTGGGKTVVGLLLLKSCLNEGVAPAIYVVPDNYLVSQVEKEAKLLGLAVEREPDAPAVLQGQAIAIINIHKIVNGLSKFGVGEQGIKLPIGAIVIDDAHACINTIESQFTVEAENTHPIYGSLLKLFHDDLHRQNDALLLEIEAEDPNASMLVPFWAWHQKQAEVVKILGDSRNDDKIKFSWPLIKNFLLHTRCVFNGRRLEISPRCIPIESIPSFINAQRRVFMTATLADDSILVSDLNADPEMVSKHITPRSANDIGDRMILAPQVIDPEITDDELRTYLKSKSNDYNVVVIVPSKFRAESFWQPVADLICDTNNIEETVNKLKTSHIGLVIFINKYDGVDLPGSACRILVLDGLPLARRLIEKIENNYLSRSRDVIGRQVQRIEQGIGRGVRANDDYCVVLLTGAELTRVLFFLEAKDMFSPATRAQLELSNEVTKQIGSGLSEIDSAMEYCLKQVSDWKGLARERLVGVGYAAQATIRPIAVAQRAAFEAATITHFKLAQNAIQEIINSHTELDNSTRGWLLWQLAEYMQYTNPVDAQNTLKKAIGLNRRLIKPLEGIDYERLDANALEQSRNATWKLRSYANNKTKLQLDINGILDNLNFTAETYKAFESAMCDVAEFIGFKAQRPETDFGKGPDVLWATGDLSYYVIECKNGASTSTVNKKDCNQLTGSVTWFNDRYDDTCNCVPLLIHPSNLFEHASTPAPDTRVMMIDDLNRFKDAVRDYAKAVGEKLETIEHHEVLKILEHNNLTPKRIIATFTHDAKQQR